MTKSGHLSGYPIMANDELVKAILDAAAGIPLFDDLPEGDHRVDGLDFGAAAEAAERFFWERMDSPAVVTAAVREWEVGESEDLATAMRDCLRLARDAALNPPSQEGGER